MPNRFPTRVDIPAETCDELAALLNQAYASSTDLASQVRQAQLTVRGNGSIALQGLFGELADTLATQAERLASRIAHIGGVPQVTVRAVAETSMLPEWDTAITSGAAIVEAVADRFELHASALRRLVETCTSLDEPGTRQLLTATTTDVEASLWRLDSYLAE